jgi:hypothetical protein
MPMQSKRSYKLKTTKTNDVEKNFVSTVSEVHTIYRAMPQKEEGATARSVAKIQQATNHTPLPPKSTFSKTSCNKIYCMLRKINA